MKGAGLTQLFSELFLQIGPRFLKNRVVIDAQHDINWAADVAFHLPNTFVQAPADTVAGYSRFINFLTYHYGQAVAFAFRVINRLDRE